MGNGNDLVFVLQVSQAPEQRSDSQHRNKVDRDPRDFRKKALPIYDERIRQEPQGSNPCNDTGNDQRLSWNESKRS